VDGVSCLQQVFQWIFSVVGDYCNGHGAVDKFIYKHVVCGVSSRTPTLLDVFVKPYTLDVVIVRAVLVSRLIDMPLVNYSVKIYVSTDGSSWSLLGTWRTGSLGTVATTYRVGGKTWFRAVFEGDSDYGPSEDVAEWEPPVQPWVGCGTRMSLNVEERADYLGIIARLVDQDGNPLQDKRIWFRYRIHGSLTDVVFDVKYTDANGYAYAEYHDKSTPVWFDAIFVGDDQCDEAYAYTEWRPNVASTYMTLGVRYDSSRNLLVLDADLRNAAGFPVPNRTVHFLVSRDGVSWTEFDSKATDTFGRASTTHRVESRLYFRAEFRGDDTYAPSMASAVWPVLRARSRVDLNVVL
jgi:hypothetical protein